jgi:hypothetical protein
LPFVEGELTPFPGIVFMATYTVLWLPASESSVFFLKKKHGLCL